MTLDHTDILFLKSAIFSPLILFCPTKTIAYYYCLKFGTHLLRLYPESEVYLIKIKIHFGLTFPL